MDDSDLLAFTPVPLRTRRDGWTPRRQFLFILLLARGRRAGRAASLLGMSRQTAYALRERPDAEGFAAAWDKAVARASQRRFERLNANRPQTGYERATYGYWVPRTYRGRIVSWTHRYDYRGQMAALNRIDRWMERNPKRVAELRDIDLDAALDVIDPGLADRVNAIYAIRSQHCRLPPPEFESVDEIRRSGAQHCQFPRLPSLALRMPAVHTRREGKRGGGR